MEDVCRKENTGDAVVFGTIERWIPTDVAWETLPPFTVLGIDEIALKKGYRDYVVIVTARLSTGRLIVLADLPERTKSTLVRWLAILPVPRRRQIRTVCTNMWEASITAVRAVLPHAEIVLDRLQVAKHHRDR